MNTDRKEDPIFSDLPRGVEGRPHKENHLPHGYFQKTEALAKLGFDDRGGDNFLGVIHAQTKQIVRVDGRKENRTTGGILVGFKDDRHRTLVAGSRSGKGRSIIIPELLTYAGSMIVIDPKGENAAISASYRAKRLSQKVCIIDPFGVTPAHCEEYRKQFNPLSLIKIGSVTVIEDAGLIADALVVSSNPKDDFWTESAKAFIEGVILYVGFGDFREEERTLLTVARLISGKIHGGIKALLSDMIDYGGPDDRVAAAAVAIKERGDNEQGGVISTARKNLKFLDYEAMEGALGHHDFDLEDLKGKQPLTIYLVLPSMRMGTCKQLLRIFVNLTLAAIEKNEAKPEYPVQMILDEMATLGYMKELENAIGQIAGLGLRITSVLQDLGQLKSLYKDRYETFLGNSGIIQFFGIVDYFTSEWVSKYLGKTTIRFAEQNSLSADAKQQGQSGMNFRSQTLELMTPEDVRRYFARDDRFNRQLVLIPGKRPCILQRANYDQHEFFEGRFDEWR